MRIVPVCHSCYALRETRADRWRNAVQELKQVQPDLRLFRLRNLRFFEKLLFGGPMSLNLMFQEHSG